MGQGNSRPSNRECVGYISVVFKYNEDLHIIPVLQVYRPPGIGNTLTVKRLEDFTDDDDTTKLSKTKEQSLERVMRFLCSGEDVTNYDVLQCILLCPNTTHRFNGFLS